ncbi:NAD(P)-dependent oxidoreductase [Streptomyces sp. NBC_00258]|nr:NAD(P)H-binding protein [Streptomyces sp. NBC_00258]
MRIALIGATGGVGAEVLPELVSRGHQVVAIVRRAGAVDPSDRVEPVLVDVHDTPRLCEALKGVDAVISAFNPGWTAPDLYRQFLAGARSIHQAAKAAGVRLLVVGGASSLYGEDGRQLFETTEYPDPFEAGVHAARDYYAEILDETELDWTFLSPPPGYPGPQERRGTYRVGADTPLLDSEGGYSPISGADLAVAIVDEIETSKQQRRRFTVAY